MTSSATAEALDAVDVAGTTIRARSAGTGPPVVVLHHSYGSPGWVALYDDLARDHRVIVPDLPGFGTSDRPEWARHPRDLALLLGHWIDRAGDGPVAVVGLGFGGWVAAELATMSPGRLSSLVLVGAAGLLPREGRILDQMLTSHNEYVRAGFSTTDGFERVYGSDFPFPDDLLLNWECNREMTARVAWKPYMYNRQMEPLLREVETPTLVVWGSDDRVVPVECATRFGELLPNARVEIVAGGGHALDLEQPEVLAPLVRAHVAR